MFFDDATESSLPLGVRMRREPGREVVAYVAYRVAPGRHTVHVAALGCDARDAVIDAPEGGVADVTGRSAAVGRLVRGQPGRQPRRLAPERGCHRDIDGLRRLRELLLAPTANP